MENVFGTAAIRTWDIPEGSLRREDSDPKVFLIQNGKKRWVTSPAVLTQLGRSFADVLVVPNGGLNTLQVGGDILLNIPPVNAFTVNNLGAKLLVIQFYNVNDALCWITIVGVANQQVAPNEFQKTITLPSGLNSVKIRINGSAPMFANNGGVINF